MLFSSATRHIPKIDRLEVDHISSSSVTVRWPSAWNVTSGDGTGYHYYWVSIRPDGGSYRSYVDVPIQPHTSNTDQFESNVTGLQFNTNYSVEVTPYIRYDDFIRVGISTGVSRFKTLCIGTWE